MKIKELKDCLESGKLDGRLKSLYVDENLVSFQKLRIKGALQKFSENFSYDEVSLFSSPGRSEISGNHTDHQHGIAVAAAVNLDVLCVASKNGSKNICLVSEGYEPFNVDIENLDFREEEKESTVALIKGILKGMENFGRKIGGFDCYMTSNVLQGSGLSSSAAFENALGTVLNHFFNDGKISSTEIAKISQFAENVYFGKPSGLLDQIASSTGGLIKIDFLNPENPSVSKIDVDFSEFNSTLCIVDTKGSHADLTDEYASIPEDMKKVAEFFGKDVLREVSPDEFYKKIPEIRKKCSDRAVLRAFHFFNEEENAEKAAGCLSRKDFKGFLATIKSSGNSSFKYLQNIYSSKNPESQNLSIAFALSDHILMDKNETKGVCSAHGGGFAGTIKAFVDNAFVRVYKQKIEEVFGENSCHLLKIRSEGSVKIV